MKKLKKRLIKSLFNYEQKNINYIELMNLLTTIKGYPILYINSNNNSTYSIKYKTFNLDKKNIIDYPINLWIKFSHSNKIDIVELKYNTTNNINLENDISSCIINPDNELFCICYYENFTPNILLMNQVELMKYIHDEYILSLYGYKKLSIYDRIALESQ